MIRSFSRSCMKVIKGRLSKISRSGLASVTFAILALMSCLFGNGLAAAGEMGDIQYLLQGDGGRVDWSDANQLLALDRAGEDEYFKIWTMDQNGDRLECLTCNHPLLPQKHHGNPAWHPTGKYIVFQAVDPDLGGIFSDTPIHKIFTNPGAGVQNNLWIMTEDASRVWQITRLGSNEGVLHPHFSPDGSKLIWAQRINNEEWIGRWVIKLASFSADGNEIRISDIRTLRPGRLLFYETHGFSPDGSSIIFTGMASGGNATGFDIYTYNLQTRALKRLTDPRLKQWDEHAHFTADGEKIIWMSSMGIPQRSRDINQLNVKTDYWMMNADGSEKKRITFFNEPVEGEPIASRVIASDLTISGDGRYMFGYIQDPGTLTRPGSDIRLQLQ